MLIVSVAAGWNLNRKWSNLLHFKPESISYPWARPRHGPAIRSRTETTGRKSNSKSRANVSEPRGASQRAGGTPLPVSLSAESARSSQVALVHWPHNNRRQATTTRDEPQPMPDQKAKRKEIEKPTSRSSLPVEGEARARQPRPDARATLSGQRQLPSPFKLFPPPLLPPLLPPLVPSLSSSPRILLLFVSILVITATINTPITGINIYVDAIQSMPPLQPVHQVSLRRRCHCQFRGSYLLLLVWIGLMLWGGKGDGILIISEMFPSKWNWIDSIRMSWSNTRW